MLRINFFRVAVIVAMATAATSVVRAQDVEQVGFVRIGDGTVTPVPDPISAASHFLSGGASNGAAGCADEGCVTDCRPVRIRDVWCAPVSVPLQRQSIGFARHYPTVWYGQGRSVVQRQAANGNRGLYHQASAGYSTGGVPHGSIVSGVYPTVGMPTDTTQLGYYYQTAPRWLPAPDRIPRMPWAPHWHRTTCDTQCGHCNHLPVQAIEVNPNAAPQQAPNGEIPPSPKAAAGQQDARSVSYFPQQ